ncbi:hypothetical protein [Candidatus Uabimicrobium sp. HlEnr_7]|uniref:hypothetical protein n=1 Tax=Candidatus Uabimicrobium helgolandensis TaxID=3095367 RepID=UPI0035563F80
MNVIVQIQLDKKPNKKVYEDMLRATKNLTNVKNSAKAYNNPDNSKIVLVEFTMKKSAQYKVVDQIA